MTYSSNELLRCSSRVRWLALAVCSTVAACTASGTGGPAVVGLGDGGTQDAISGISDTPAAYDGDVSGQDQSTQHDGISVADAIHGGDTVTTIDGGPIGFCGDGNCTGGETAKNCPVDCSDVEPNPMACVASQCTDAYIQCKQEKTCSILLQCALGCTNAQCVQGCFLSSSGPPSIAAKQLLACGAKTGCLGPVGGFCGDGACSAGESPMNCPPDCGGPPPFQCGNGKCEPGEGPGTCPGDCGQTSVCGDGVCNPQSETPDSCPMDCQLKPGNEMIACAKMKCEAEFMACQSQDLCAMAIACMAGCKESTCYEACAKKAGNNQALDGLGECLMAQGCLLVAPLCGDGQCVAPENTKNCPADCGGGPSDLLTCVQNACPKQLNNCLSQKACASAVQCFLGCQDDACFGKCMNVIPPDAFAALEPLMTCAQQSGCTPGNTGPICGDGMCEPGETAANCPLDCGAKPCKGKGDCASAEVCCDTGNGPHCVPSGSCG